MLYNSGLRTLVRIVEVSVIGESIFGGSTVFLFPAQKEEGYYVYNYKLMLNLGVNSSLGFGLSVPSFSGLTSLCYLIEC